MKRLTLISVIFLIPFLLKAQINIDSAGYKAISFCAYVDKDGEVYKSQELPSNHLFFFTPEKMIYEVEYKERDIYFTESPKENWLNVGEHLPHLVFLNSKDIEGSKCSVVITHDTEDDLYYVSVVYKDINFAFTCLPTDRRPWDNDPYTVDQMIEDQNKYPENPKYTEEEIDDFFMEVEEKTGVNHKVAKTFIMNEFIKDIKE